jgi:hypothetical protein
MPIGLVQQFPKDQHAWGEADRLGLSVRINKAPTTAPRVSFHFLAERYLEADFGADALRPKSVNTTGHVEHVVRAYLVPRFGHEIAGHPAARHSEMAEIPRREQRPCMEDI